MKLDLDRPCDQCPFRRVSPAGWLGPWEPKQLIFALGRQPFPCHQTINTDDQNVEDDTLQGCAGAAIFLNNKVERSRYPITQDHQDLVAGASQDAKQSVFGTTKEFVDHHESGNVRSWELKLGSD